MSFSNRFIREFIFGILFFSYLSIWNIIYADAVKSKTFFYTYKTNISYEAQKSNLLRLIIGQVYITEIAHDGNKDTDIKLWQITLAHKVPKNSGALVMEAVTIHKAGLIDRILIPNSESYTKISELNLLKGLISLFNVRNTFESDYEIDSSGECQVSYAQVDTKESDAGTDYLYVDKLKQRCRSLSKPLDQWHRSSLPVGEIHSQKQAITRYKIDRLDAKLMKITGFEKQTYSLLKDNEKLGGVHNVTLISWQEMDYRGIMSGQTDKLRQKLSQLNEVDENEIGDALFGFDYETIHLTLAHSVFPTSCGLNTNLYPNDSSHGFLVDYSIKITLRRQLESVQDSLKSINLGHIKYTHPILQLIQSLRCLPDTREAVELLTDLTLLCSPALDPESLLKQANTWRDQLVDVLVGCGTGTCTDVLLQRLQDLTNLINGKHGSVEPSSKKWKVYEKLLFNKLWPSLAQLKRLKSSRMKQLISCCQSYSAESHNHICLVTLSNLWDKVMDEHEDDSETIIHMIFELLNIHKPQKSDKNLSMLKGPNRKKLMIGIIATSLVKNPRFIPALLDIALKSDHIPMVLRTIALRSVTSIQFSDPVLLGGSNNHDWLHIAILLKQTLLKPPTHMHDDVLLGQEIVRSLLQGEMPIHELADLLRQLSIQKRWELVRVGRIIVQQWCKARILNLDDCFCFEHGFKNTTDVRCHLGLAASWFGLVGHNQTESGKATLLTGELANMKDNLVIDYSSQFVLGTEGGLRMSDLVVNLLSPDSDSSLFEFGIYADGLNAKNFGLNLGKTSDDSDETWFTVNLRILGTNLVPWEIFSGGLSQMLKLFWSVPNKPTSVLQNIQLIADERIQTSFSSGWTIMVDSLGIMSLDLSGAMETSLWTQTGRSLVRTRVGVVMELQAYVQDLFPDFSLQMISQGLGFEGHMDFVTVLDLKHLPESMCMGMSQGIGTRFVIYERQRLLEDTASRRKKFVVQDLFNPVDYTILCNTTFVPVSYDLGSENSAKCRKMNANTLW